MTSKAPISLTIVMITCLVVLITLGARDSQVAEINGNVDFNRDNAEVVFRSFTTGTAEVSITEIDPSGFPEIEVYVDVVDSFGVLMCGLEEEDFCVYQDGELVNFVVTSLDTAYCPTSVCLVMDVSGSMLGDPLDDAKDAARSFVRRMAPEDRAAIVAYASCVETVTGFTSDTTILINAINSMGAAGRTAMFDGFWLGVDLACPESGVRAVIGFTDGCENNSQACWPPPDGGWAPEDYEDDCDTVAFYADLCNLPVHAIGVGRDICPEQLICLAENTGGNYYHAPSAEELDSIYAEIQADLCCRYVFTYTSPDTIMDCTNHQVVVCEGGMECTPCDTGYYQELCPPVITRTPPTIELSDTCQFHSQDLVIQAWVVDGGAPFVQQVLLFWRVTGSGDPYTQMTMTPQGGDLYEATIPGASVPMGTPGADYYITATDGELSVSAPPHNPQVSPYQIEICPNQPPIITDVWFVDDTCVVEGEPFPIMCEVLDTTDWVDSVQLFHRPTGGSSYDMVLMSAQGGDEYLGTIPGSSAGPDGIDFYIRAVDNYGSEAYHGDAAGPRHIPICPNDPPVITAVWYPDTNCVWPGNPFPIMCEVFDTTDFVDSVYLFYRRGGEVSYEEAVMMDQGGDQYLGVVPGSFAGPAGIDYYIRAVDNFNLEGFFASAADPVHVDTCPHELAPPVELPFDTCVYQGRNTCIPVIIDSLPPYDIFSASMVLFYDPSVIQATHATTDNGIAESWGPPDTYVTPGSILVSMNGATALASPGVLVWVCFDATGEIGDSTMLEFMHDSVTFNESRYPATPGIIRVCPWGTTVDFDIKPTSCPNPLNVLGGGVLPVAILGGEDFDASSIDPTSVRLEGVAPLRWGVQDVAAPVVPDPDDSCECTTDGPDGFADMTFKFWKQAIVAALQAQQPLVDGEIRVLTITGMTTDSIPIEAQDCMWIRHTGEPADDPQLAGAYGLEENYPNPFNPETDISFTLPARTHVSLTIYNIVGKKVRTLVNGEVDAGTHTVHWNGRDQAGNWVATGVYFYRLKTRDFDRTMKMVLMK